MTKFEHIIECTDDGEWFLSVIDYNKGRAHCHALPGDSFSLVGILGLFFIALYGRMILLFNNGVN